MRFYFNSFEPLHSQSIDSLVATAAALPLDCAPGAKVLIQTQEARATIVAMIGVWQRGAIPILDPKLMQDPAPFAAVIQAVPPVTKAERPNCFTVDSSWQIGFSTSGSSARPQVIIRQLGGLLTEAEVLRQLFELGPGQQVIALIPPIHIYGFLYSFLLPLNSSCDVFFLTPLELQRFHKRPDLLVMVPALWSAVAHFLSSHPIATLVSSGAPFGADRRQQLGSELVGNCGRALEVLGSTETGGLGYADLLNPSDDSFTLFAGITITTDGPRQILNSSFAPELSNYVLQDKLKFTSSGRFRHAGRSDRIIKFAGQRWSLEVIEQCLAAVPQVHGAKCHFLPDSDLPKGGTLIAWLVTTDSLHFSRSQLAQSYRALTKAPLPSRIFFVDEFPRDANGKTTVAELLKLTHN